SNEPDKSFKCNYNSRYLLKCIKNTLNTVCDDKNEYQANIDQAIEALKALFVAVPVPGLAKVGIESFAEVEVSISDFDIEKSWNCFKEVCHVEPSGKPWYTTWRQLMILQDSLDKWCQQKESSISVNFKEKMLL